MEADLTAISRHARVAFSFSGGKDSTAVWHLLADAGLLGRVTTYHMDTGDLLPETREVVSHYAAQTPNFVRVQGSVGLWMMENGLPTDLLPHSAHPVGRHMGESKTVLVSRYDCCYTNLMLPIFQRITGDGNTLLIRGTKAVDMPRLPCGSGDVLDGVEICYPIQERTNAEVFAYLARAGARLSPIYEHVTNSPECATCPAWWGEKRAAYLKQRHPLLYRRYKARLDLVVAEIAPVLRTLLPEIDETPNAPPLPVAEMEDASDELGRAGIRVLQGTRLGSDDVAHTRKLAEFMVLSEGAVVLDAGCGTGEMARIIGAQRRDLQFVLLNKAPRQILEAPSGARYQRVVGDFHSVPLPDASVDVTWFCYALCHGDHAVALREAARVTRAGGHLFIYDYERMGGDNATMERVLFARAFSAAEVVALAGMAGWVLEATFHPEGDDLFGPLLNDPALHDSIFGSLRPVVWRFTRSSTVARTQKPVVEGVLAAARAREV